MNELFKYLKKTILFQKIFKRFKIRVKLLIKINKFYNKEWIKFRFHYINFLINKTK